MQQHVCVSGNRTRRICIRSQGGIDQIDFDCLIDGFDCLILFSLFDDFDCLIDGFDCLIDDF